MPTVFQSITLWSCNGIDDITTNSHPRAWAVEDCWWRPQTARPLFWPARSAFDHPVQTPRRKPVYFPDRWALWSRATTTPRAGSSAASLVAKTPSTNCTDNPVASWTDKVHIRSEFRCWCPVSRNPFLRRLARKRCLESTCKINIG